jgi:hypothetical protein
MCREMSMCGIGVPCWRFAGDDACVLCSHMLASIAGVEREIWQHRQGVRYSPVDA